MDVTAFIARIRDHYVDQFRSFAEHQRANSTSGASEVKLQLGEHSKVFDRLYCADFVKNDGGAIVVELQPDSFLSFEPIGGSFGPAALSIDHLRWDDVVIEHDLAALPAESLSRWFRLWFDPQDERHDETAELSGVIHSLIDQPHSISIDFGTADPEAFWDMLQLLDDAGATRIRIGSSRAESADPDQ